MEQQLQALEPRMLSRPAETAVELAALLAQARAQRDHYAETYAVCLLGGCAFFQGDFATTLAYGQESKALARRYGFQALEVRSLNAVALASWRLGQMADALENFQASLRLASDMGDQVGRGRVLNNLGAIYLELEDYERAYQNFLQAAELAQRHERPEYAADALSGMADALYLLKRYEEAQALIPQAMQLAQQYQVVRTIGNLYHLESNLLHHFGRYQDSLQRAAQGLKQAEEAGDAEGQAFLQLAIAKQYLALKNTVQAQEHLQLAVQLADHMGHLRLQSDTTLARAELFETLGDEHQANAALRQYLQLRATLHDRSRKLQSQAISRQIQLEVLKREAQAERERNTELTQTNRRLEATQSELSYRASHDTLTGLLNRAAFWQQTEQRLAERPEEEYAGILFADIDHLKTVNDTHGHAAGDILIKEIARRFEAELRTADLMGRLSGDEFMIYLTHLAHPDDIGVVAQKLLKSLQAPIHVNDAVIQPAVSLGSVVVPSDGRNLTELHHHADLALYQAKQQGRNVWVGFEAELSAGEKRRRLLKEELKNALELGQFQLHYQPQFLLPNLELVGVEALLRWPHPDLGWVSPAEFIPLAEESRLILDLGQWVLREGLRQAREWAFAARGLVMSVNVSVRQFEQADFVENVRQALQDFALPGDCVVLELTETMLHQDAQVGVRVVEGLHQLGVRIAIDDFGTGYSSLRLLKQLPFRQLKIDRSFVNDLTAEDHSLSSARHFMEVMLNLAHGLGIRVVAEGVETQEQLDLLSELHCDKAQGFFLARPMNAASFQEKYLAAQSVRG